MDLIYVIGLLAVTLTLLPQFATYLTHILYILASSKRAGKTGLDTPSSTVPAEISFILPVRNEPPDYVVRALEHIKSLGIHNYEVMIVSDDDEAGKKSVLAVFESARNSGVNVWFVWRSEPRGMRTGALNTGLYASRGRYVYVYDVDTLPERGFFEHALSILERCDDCIGVVARWEPLNSSSKVSESLAYGLRYLNTILYEARSKLGLHIYPLGTGTLYKAEVLKSELGGWDAERVQDDAELGARLLQKGYRVVYLNTHAVKVENPSTYKSFRIQQSRWAYGALDAALSRLRCFVSSKRPLAVRLEALAYLLHYVPSTTSFIGALLLSTLALLNPANYVESTLHLTILWILALVAYVATMRIVLRELNLQRLLIVVGRLGALATAILPFVTMSSLKALFRLREVYKRTPKGIYEKVRKKRRVPWEFILGLYFVAGSTTVFVRGYLLTGLVLLSFATSFLYVTFRFWRDVFYE